MRHPSNRQGVLEFKSHQNHKGFEYEESPLTRSYIFSCIQCNRRWDIDVSTLKDPKVRAQFYDKRSHYLNFGIKAIKKAQERALAKSRQLLFRFTPRDEVRKLKRLGYIEVTGTDSRVYKIEESGYHNITTVIDGVLHRYCLMSSIEVPKYDTVLAQKLWLETDTEGFLRTANLVEEVVES